MSLRKTSDVIIDMDCVEMDEGARNEVTVQSTGTDCDLEEFPEEDDAMLVSAVDNFEFPGVVEPGALEELEKEIGLDPALSQPSRLTEQMIAEDVERRKELDSFRRFKPLDKIFPDVRCSEHNTVAFTVKPDYTPGDLLEPNPSKCVFKWEPKYVPMPFHKENKIPPLRFRVPPAKVDNENQESSSVDKSSTAEVEERPNHAIHKISLWERISDTLTSAKILCSQDFVPVFKRYCRIVTSEFKALNYCMEQIMTPDERIHFFQRVVPFMVSLVLRTKEIVTCPLPLLKKNINHNISLSQKQVACLLANAFFSTFPNVFETPSDAPSINFKELFIEDDERILIVKAQKIRCLINYFTRVESKMPNGVVTYTRKNLRHSNMPDWSKLDKGLSKLVPLLQGTIEDDGAGMLQVDFANCIIGGGVLGRGAVQEEILFVIYPELILTRLFTEKLNYNEAVIITGSERFSSYQGYSSNFKFDGDYEDTTPYDSKGRRCTQIVAIDALYINRHSFQYHPKHVLRELNKAYVGFSSPTTLPVAVATGKWGCGAFNGDPQLKTIIQWLAASLAGRDIAVFTFEDVSCLNDILSIRDAISNMKIKDVMNLLSQYHKICCSTKIVNRSLKEFCEMIQD